MLALSPMGASSAKDEAASSGGAALSAEPPLAGTCAAARTAASRMEMEEDALRAASIASISWLMVAVSSGAERARSGQRPHT
jgi:hypothetical protein